MHFQSFVYTVAGALIFAAAAFGQPGSPTAGSQQPTKRSAVPRTADGKPDLQGVWSFATLTPLERPAEFAGKAYLTPQEAKEYAKRTMQRNNKDKRDGGAEADVSRAYNELFYDYGASASLQTSLIIDPPDGKLPALTPEGKKRAEARVTAMTRLPRGPEDRSLNERCILGFNSGPPMFPSAYNKRRIGRDLAKSGLNVWLDRARLSGGANWTAEIEQALDDSDIVEESFMERLSSYGIPV